MTVAMHYESLKISDGTELAFQTSISTSDLKTSTKKASTCILLMHGFSGSSEYFRRNFELAQHSWIVAPDMRGHGRSQHTKGGYHVARLACDLKELIEYLSSLTPTRFYPVGCSIGATVLWTYVELFGNTTFLASGSRSGGAFNGMIFVDQAPLQDRSIYGDWDETKAHYGLYDEATLLEAQKVWSGDDKARAVAHKGLVDSCLGYRAFPESPEHREECGDQDEKFFTGISASCDGVWLSRLMADHTRYDHREAIELIDVPVLVMAGKKSGCFPIDGMLETVRRVNVGSGKSLAKASIYDCGHWLFYEEPEKFNREVLEFVRGCEELSNIAS